ncbi:MAG TPA: PAS domain S-box protein [Candidatus Limnocylindrales bacterium]|nr:PAS domain S-box protein [Candidatus Limnocylindrales bacterium]
MENQNKSAQWFFDQADTLMIAIGSDELIADINRKASEILGCSRREVKGKNWFDTFVPKKEKEDARRLFHDMLTGSLRHMHTEHSLIARKGEELTFNFHNILVCDEKGKTVGVISSGDEVTERKRKEETLKEVERRLQVSLDFMIEGCQIIDYDWRYVYVNEAAAEQGRKKKEELLGYTMMQVYPGIDRTEMFNNLRNCMTNRVPHQMENEFTFPDGSKGWFDLHMEPVPEGVLILSADITKSKTIEAELNGYRHRLEQVIAQRTAECAIANEELTKKIDEAQKTEEALKLRATILENAREAIFLINTKGDFVYANTAATEAYLYSLDEFLNMNIRVLLPPKDASSLEELLRHIMEKRKATLEMVHLRKGGGEMSVKVHSNVVKTMHGEFIVVVIRKMFSR